MLPASSKPIYRYTFKLGRRELYVETKGNLKLAWQGAREKTKSPKLKHIKTEVIEMSILSQSRGVVANRLEHSDRADRGGDS